MNKELIKELETLLGVRLGNKDGYFGGTISSDLAIKLMLCERLDAMTEEMKKLTFQVEQLQTEIRHLPIE